MTTPEAHARQNIDALIQMATGSGKTFTAVNFVYRLIKHAKAQRVLFLVDRNNLDRQVLKEFDQSITPDDGHKFSEEDDRAQPYLGSTTPEQWPMPIKDVLL